MDELDTSFLTGVKKSNAIDVYECHVIKVQRKPRPTSFHLPFQFLQMVRLYSTAQTNPRLETAGVFFKFDCHL